MDPTACWQLWDDYVCEGELEDAQYAAMDLIAWFNKGGFAPKWTDEQSFSIGLQSRGYNGRRLPCVVSLG